MTANCDGPWAGLSGSQIITQLFQKTQLFLSGISGTPEGCFVRLHAHPSFSAWRGLHHGGEMVFGIADP